MNTLEAIKTRRSIRKYSDQKVEKPLFLTAGEIERE